MISPLPFNILIVDDSPEFVKSFTNLLLDAFEPQIASVKYAYNGLDGLELMRDNYFHYVFMDIDMPGVDGITATRFATYEYTESAPKIIAISFHTEQTYRKQIMRAGASVYLSKDEIDADALAEIFNC
jgi:CheY-like chemotaxis protein